MAPLSTRAAWARVAGTAALACALAVSTLAPAHAATWTDPATIGAGGSVAAQPSVATGPTGSSVVAWAVPGAVMAARRAAGGGWGGAEQIASVPDGTSPPTAFVDSRGRAVVVWSRGRVEGTPGEVWAAEAFPGQAWSAPRALGAGVGMVHLTHTLLTDDSVFVTFSDEFQVRGARYTYSGQWVGAGILPPTPAGGFTNSQSAVALPGGGLALQYFGGSFDPTLHRQYSSTWLPTTGWGPVEAVPGPRGSNPAIALRPDGARLMAWPAAVGSELTERNLWIAERTPAGAWGPATNLRTAPAEQSMTSVGAVSDSTGTVHVVWAEGPASARVVRYASRAPGGAWSAVAPLSAAGAVRGPWISVLPGDVVRVVWQRQSGGATVVESIERAASAWGDVQSLGQGIVPTTSPEAAGAGWDGDGNGVVAWRPSATSVRVRALDGAAPYASSVVVPATTSVRRETAVYVTAVDAWSPVASVAWTFGDGGTAVGDRTSYVWRTPGTYEVSATMIDAGGRARPVARTITVTDAGGRAPARITKFAFKPRTLRLTGPRKKRRVSAVVSLDSASKVTFTWSRKVRKKLKNGKTKMVTKKVATTSRTLKAGRTRFTVTAKLSKKKRLRPGRYVVVARTATSRKKATLRVRP